MVLFVLIASAQAWDLEQAHFTPGLSAAATALLPGSDPAVAARFQDRGLDVYDPSTGFVTAHTVQPGTALAWLPDGSGIVACTLDATVWHTWDGATLGPEVQLAATPCDAVASRSSDVAVLVGGEVSLTAGVTLQPTGLTGDLLAVRGDDVAVADLNAASFTVREDGVERTVSVGSTQIRSLASSDGRWWTRGLDGWTSDDGKQLPGEHATTGDIDGDGLLDLITTAHEDGDLWVWPSLHGIPRMLHLSMVAHSVAPVDGVACGAVIGPRTVGEGEFYHRSVFCGGDADADGFTSEAGDCDDADPHRFPDQPEQCGPRDLDCDGVPYPIPFVVGEVPDRVGEGETVTFDHNGCELRDQGPYCVQAPLGTSCTFPDEGTYEVVLGYPDTAEHDVAISFEVFNQPPALVFEEETLRFTRREDGHFQLLAVDPGQNDVIAFETLDAPPWLHLSEDGVVTGRPTTLRRWDVLRYALTDDDGAWVEHEVETEVTARNPDLGCGPEITVSCASSPHAPLSWGALLLPLWLIRRRSGKGPGRPSTR